MKQHKFLKALNDALFPNGIKCILCNGDLKIDNDFELCDDCIKRIVFNHGKTCLKCGKNLWAGANYCTACKDGTRYFDKARAPLLHLHPMNFLIMQLKYKGKLYLAKPFAEIMKYEYLRSDFLVDLVLPIPMHYKRKRERGYNQAEILAEEFCKITKLPLDTENFVRMIDTQQQARMNRREREENLKNAFRVVDTNAVKNKNILLIDDIITTGATIDECARVLKKCGANKVFALALAHAPSKIYTIKQNITLYRPKTFVKSSKIRYNKSKV